MLSSRNAVEDGGEDFGEVIGVPAREMADLLAAAEAVGQDERPAAGASHRRQKPLLPDLHGNAVMFAFKAEGAGHAAATGIQDFKIKPEPA